MLFLVYFNSFSWCILTFTGEESPKVLKIAQIFNFEGVWNELFAKNCFYRQSWSKYIETLKDLMKNQTFLKNDTASFLPFYKIGKQKLSFFMGIGN